MLMMEENIICLQVACAFAGSIPYQGGQLLLRRFLMILGHELKWMKEGGGVAVQNHQDHLGLKIVNRHNHE